MSKQLPPRVLSSAAGKDAETDGGILPGRAGAATGKHAVTQVGERGEQKGRRGRWGGRRTRVVRRLIIHVSVIIIGLAMFLPFYWILSASVMTYEEVTAIPPRWVPSTPQWGNYGAVLRDPNVPLFKYFSNSFIVSAAVTVAVLLTSSLAGYALAKLKFPGRDAVFTFTLSTMMFPVFLFLIPVYYILKRFPLLGGNNILGMGGTGALQSYVSLILPFVVSAWGIFLMRQFMMTIPDELIDAARIDGASDLGIFGRVMMPLVKPALATLAIFTFIGQWNYFLWPMIVTTSAPHLMTVPVGLRLMGTAYSTAVNMNKLLAATVMAITPSVCVFLALQRYYIKGFVLSGFK
ncbi:MAG: carbohydrate ABC transporter permease [Clostridia bacterium]